MLLATTGDSETGLPISIVPETDPSLGETKAIWPRELARTSRLPARTGPRQKIGPAGRPRRRSSVRRR